jgi:hypothetical protein
MATGHAASNVRWALRFLIGLFFVAAGFLRLQALAQAPAAGIPAAPPGGIDAAKLPDTNGVHLGMSQDQAVAAMKALYPGNLLTIYYDKHADGTVWIARLSGVTAQNCSSNCDSMEVYLSMPPSPVQVVSIHRGLILPSGKQPTLDTTVASLRQKYGKELASSKGGPGVLAWAYDEQGQPANPQGPSNWNPADCGGGSIGTTSGYTDPKQPMEVDAALPPIPLAQQLPGLTGNLCNRNVFVTAQVLQGAAIQGVPVVQQIFMFLGENPLMIRDAVADQQYFDSQAAAKQQQQQKNAQQQKAPTL